MKYGLMDSGEDIVSDSDSVQDLKHLSGGHHQLLCETEIAFVTGLTVTVTHKNDH